MTHTDSDAGAIAERVKAALQSADLDAFTELLDPNVQWGAPDDNAPSCQNRKQVVRWYQRGRDAGVRADVVEIVAGKDHLLVGLQVRGRSGEGGAVERWQVMTIRAGRVVDIRAFDDRTEAAARAGMS